MLYDVLVIGAGPAGLSAAINVRQRGGQVLVIGTAQETNPLWKSEEVNNYPGLPGISGKDLLLKLKTHAEKCGAEFCQGRALNASYNQKRAKWMVGVGTEIMQGKALVYAGGVVRGKTYPGETQLLGRGVSYCATCDGMLYRGKDVIVIGSGEADREEAAFLEEIGCKVQYFERPKNVELLGEQALTQVQIDGECYPADGAFILRPGVSPSYMFSGLETDGKYVLTDREMKTNLPALYAAGDCTGGLLQAAKAVGEGLIAGQNAIKAVKSNEEHA